MDDDEFTTFPEAIQFSHISFNVQRKFRRGVSNAWAENYPETPTRSDFAAARLKNQGQHEDIIKLLQETCEKYQSLQNDDSLQSPASVKRMCLAQSSDKLLTLCNYIVEGFRYDAVRHELTEVRRVISPYNRTIISDIETCNQRLDTTRAEHSQVLKDVQKIWNKSAQVLSKQKMEYTRLNTKYENLTKVVDPLQKRIKQSVQKNSLLKIDNTKLEQQSRKITAENADYAIQIREKDSEIQRLRKEIQNARNTANQTLQKTKTELHEATQHLTRAKEQLTSYQTNFSAEIIRLRSIIMNQVLRNVGLTFSFRFDRTRCQHVLDQAQKAINELHNEQTITKDLLFTSEGERRKLQNEKAQSISRLAISRWRYAYKEAIITQKCERLQKLRQSLFKQHVLHIRAHQTLKFHNAKLLLTARTETSTIKQENSEMNSEIQTLGTANTFLRSQLVVSRWRLVIIKARLGEKSQQVTQLNLHLLARNILYALRQRAFHVQHTQIVSNLQAKHAAAMITNQVNIQNISRRCLRLIFRLCLIRRNLHLCTINSVVKLTIVQSHSDHVAATLQSKTATCKSLEERLQLAQKSLGETKTSYQALEFQQEEDTLRCHIAEVLYNHASAQLGISATPEHRSTFLSSLFKTVSQIKTEIIPQAEEWLKAIQGLSESSSMAISHLQKTLLNDSQLTLADLYSFANHIMTSPADTIIVIGMLIQIIQKTSQSTTKAFTHTEAVVVLRMLELIRRCCHGERSSEVVRDILHSLQIRLSKAANDSCLVGGLIKWLSGEESVLYTALSLVGSANDRCRIFLEDAELIADGICFIGLRTSDHIIQHVGLERVECIMEEGDKMIIMVRDFPYTGTHATTEYAVKSETVAALVSHFGDRFWSLGYEQESIRYCMP